MLSKKIIQSSIYLFTSLTFANLNAQTDTEFWFAFTGIDASYGISGPNDVAQNIGLRISAMNEPATVTVKFPGDPSKNFSFNVAANQTYTYPLVSADEAAMPNNKAILEFFNPKPGESFPQNNGMIVESSARVSAYVDYQHGGDDEYFNLKGKSALGKDFFLPFQSAFNPGKELSGPEAYASFSFVATEDNTTVQIIPTKDLIGHPAGIAYNVTLNKGQSYTGFAPQANSYSDPGVQPTGTSVKVLSGGDIAVTIATELAASYQAAVDMEGDQIVPIKSVGSEYVIFNANIGGEEHSDDHYTFVATEDNTTITLSSGETQNLNKGQSWDYTWVTNGVVPTSFKNVTSNKPVYLYHTTVINKEVASTLVPSANLGGSKNISVNFNNVPINNTNPTFRIYITADDKAVNSGFNMSLTNGGTSTTYNNSNISFQDIPGKPGFKGGFLTINMNDLNQFPDGQDLTFKITNDNLFNLAVTTVTNGGSSVFGYFSDFMIQNTYEYYTLKTSDVNCNPTHTLAPGSSNAKWYKAGPTLITQNVLSLEISDDKVWVEYTDPSGGNKVDTVKVTRYPTPILSDKNFCAAKGESVNFDATVNSKVNPIYKWTKDAITESNVATFTASTADHYGTHTASIKSTYCTLSIPVKTETTCGLKAELFANRIEICSGDTTALQLKITGGSGDYTYTWTPLLAANGVTYIVSPKNTTEYSVSVFDKQMLLTVVAKVSVAVLEKPTVTVNSAELCKGANTTLTANGSTKNGAINYSWSPTARLNTSTGESVIASPSTSTQYNVIATDSKGCKDTAQNIVTVFSKPIVAVPDYEICFGESKTLSAQVFKANGAVTYTWSPATNLNTTIGKNVISSATTTTTYSVMVKDSKGCGDTSTASITVNKKPIVNCNDVQICKGESAKLLATTNDGTGTINYNWSPTENLNTSTGDQVQATPLSSTTYTIIAEDEKGCKDTTTTSVTIKSSPIAYAGKDSTVCEKINIQLGKKGSINVSHSWFPKNNLSNDTISSPLLTLENTGTTIEKHQYIVSSTMNGCVTKDTVEITVYPALSVEITSTEQPVCKNESVTLQASGGVNYVWSNGATTASTTIHPETSGYYHVTLENVCVARDSIYIKVKNDESYGGIYIPNAFTPNNDGENDVFEIKGTYIADLQVIIFDRWGNLLHQWDGMNGSWDGKVNGSVVQTDVYVYKVSMKTECNAHETVIGKITALK